MLTREEGRALPLPGLSRYISSDTIHPFSPTKKGRWSSLTPGYWLGLPWVSNRGQCPICPGPAWLQHQEMPDNNSHRINIAGIVFL